MADNTKTRLMRKLREQFPDVPFDEATKLEREEYVPCSAWRSVSGTVVFSQVSMSEAMTTQNDIAAQFPHIIRVATEIWYDNGMLQNGITVAMRTDELLTWMSNGVVKTGQRVVAIMRCSHSAPCGIV